MSTAALIEAAAKRIDPKAFAGPPCSMKMLSARDAARRAAAEAFLVFEAERLLDLAPERRRHTG